MQKKSSKKSQKKTEDELESDELDDDEVEEQDDDEVEELDDEEVEEQDDEEAEKLDDEEIEELDDEEAEELDDEEVEEPDDEEVEELNDEEVEELDDEEVEELGEEEIEELNDEELEELGEDVGNEAESKITGENEENNFGPDNLSADSESLDESSDEVNKMKEDEGVEEVHFSEEELESETESESDSESDKSVSIKELTEKNTKRNEIEAAIFIAGRPVSVEELGIKLEMKKKEVQELIEQLAYDYMDRTTSIEIAQIGDKYTMQIKPEYTDKVKGFTTGGLIPEAVMRTLTVIALKQPIPKALLVKMRGSTAYQHVKFLEDRGFIDSYKKGRSSVLTTTDQFSDTFGLSRDVKTLKKQLVQELGVKLPAKEDSEDSGNPDDS